MKTKLGAVPAMSGSTGLEPSVMVTICGSCSPIPRAVMPVARSGVSTVEIAIKAPEPKLAVGLISEKACEGSDAAMFTERLNLTQIRSPPSAMPF